MIQTKRYNQGMQYHLHAPVELLLPSQARQEGCAGTHPLPAQRGGHPVAEHESQRCPRQPRAGLGRGSRPARGLSRHSRAHRAWAVGSLLTMRSQSPAFTPHSSDGGTDFAASLKQAPRRTCTSRASGPGLLSAVPPTPSFWHWFSTISKGRVPPTALRTTLPPAPWLFLDVSQRRIKQVQPPEMEAG